MSDEREGLDPESADLLASMVEANVRNLAHTNDRIQEALRDDRDAYAASFCGLYDALERIPIMTRTVYIDRLLDRHAHTRQSAREVLDRATE